MPLTSGDNPKEPMTAAEKAAERRMIEELHQRWEYRPLDAVSPAFNAGCDLSFTVADFQPKHFKQEDVSLNKTLWELWPTDWAKLDSYVKFYQEKADRLFHPEADSPYDSEKLAQALPLVERARIGFNLRLLNDLHVRLHSTGLLPWNKLDEGISPFMHLQTRKRMFDVTALDHAVEMGKQLMVEADELYDLASSLRNDDDNKDETPSEKEERHELTICALGVYCSALMRCWPWTASGLIMGPKTAFDSGLAQLEATLWHKIATAMFTLVGYKDRKLSTHFTVLARVCNLVPVLTRYVPLDMYFKCHSQMMLYAVFLSSIGFGAELMCGAWSVPFMDAFKDGCEVWAHSGCSTRHITCTPEANIAQLRKLDKRDCGRDREASSAKFELLDSDASGDASGEDSDTPGGSDLSTRLKRKKSRNGNNKAKEKSGNSKNEIDSAEEETEDQIKYYDRKGKVVGHGPRVPMRFSGHVMDVNARTEDLADIAANAKKHQTDFPDD